VCGIVVRFAVLHSMHVMVEANAHASIMMMVEERDK